MVVLLALLVVTVCAPVHGAVGSGLDLPAVPLLLLVDPALVPGPALVAGLAIAVLVAGRELTAVDRLTSWAVGGLVPGTAAIGGPPMALLHGRADGARLRSTLSVVFVAAFLIALGALTAVGRFDSSDLTTSLVLLPGVVAGFLLPGPLRRRVDRGRTRPAVLTLSAVAALGAVLQGLLG